MMRRFGRASQTRATFPGLCARGFRPRCAFLRARRTDGRFFMGVSFRFFKKDESFGFLFIRLRLTEAKRIDAERLKHLVLRMRNG